MYKPKNRKVEKISFVEINKQMYIPEIYSGNFRDLLPFAMENPATMESAHMRLFRLLVRQGIDPELTDQARRTWGDKDLFSFKAFEDFYGLEPAIQRLMSTLAASAHASEPAYSIFFLVGPPSSGKSAISNRVKHVIASGEPGLALGGSQMRAHPLSLLRMIPLMADMHAKTKSKTEIAGLRADMLRALNLHELLRFDNGNVKSVFSKQGIATPSFEALCNMNDAEAFTSALVFGLGFTRGVRSVISFPDFAIIDRCLGKEGQADPVRLLAEWQIESFKFMGEKEGSVGIASLKESEPLKYDKAESVGEDNVRRLGEEDPEDHEQVVLNGVYNRGNRGIVEFVEAAKNSILAFRTMLDASQDKSVPAPSPLSNRALLADLVIWAHTNEDELRKLFADPGNDPYRDRIIRLNTPHVVPAPAIGKVLTKLWTRSDMADCESIAHVALEPLVPEMLGRFLSFTRMIPDREVTDPSVQIDILAGNHFRLKETGTKYLIEQLLKRAGSRQGMVGETNRFVCKVVDERAGLAYLCQRRYLTSLEVFEEVVAAIRRNREDGGEDLSKDETEPSKTVLGRREAFVKGPLAKWRAKQLARHVRIAMVANEAGEDLRSSFVSRYVEAVDNLLGDETSVSGEDRRFVGEVEGHMGVSTAQADSYREELRRFRSLVLDARDAYEQKYGDSAPLPHTFYPPLRKAIDRMTIQRMSPSIAIGVLRAGKTGSESQKRQLTGTLGRMVSLLGYTDDGARAVIEEVEQKGYLDLVDTDEED